MGKKVFWFLYLAILQKGLRKQIHHPMSQRKYTLITFAVKYKSVIIGIENLLMSLCGRFRPHFCSNNLSPNSSLQLFFHRLWLHRYNSGCRRIFSSSADTYNRVSSPGAVSDASSQSRLAVIWYLPRPGLLKPTKTTGSLPALAPFSGPGRNAVRRCRKSIQ